MAPPGNRATAAPRGAVVAAVAVAAGSPEASPTPPADVTDAASRSAALAAYATEWADCTRCRLAEGRTQVVFGVGDPNADLMFVGEAPGFHEDQQGYPFVGQAGKLLDRLLGGIGLARDRVYIANVIKCRPPGNRDPQPDEIEACERHLFRQLELVQPTLVATLGNFATKLLSGKPHGITRVRDAANARGGLRAHPGAPPAGAGGGAGAGGDERDSVPDRRAPDRGRGLRRSPSGAARPLLTRAPPRPMRGSTLQS
jgi:uracil-DNA glycosylase family 4